MKIHFHTLKFSVEFKMTKFINSPFPTNFSKFVINNVKAPKWILQTKIDGEEHV